MTRYRVPIVRHISKDRTGDVRIALTTLSRYRVAQYQEALADIAKQLSWPELTAHTLTCLFRRHKLSGPTYYCIDGGKAVLDEEDPATQRSTPSPSPSPSPPPSPSSADTDPEPGTDRSGGVSPLAESVPDPEPPPPTPPREPARILEDMRATRQAARVKAERDALADQLREAHARLGFMDAMRSIHVPEVVRREPTSGLREGSLVVLASDWHVEEEVDPVAIADLNAYNLDISARRVERFFAGVEWALNYHRQAFVLRDLILWWGGDLYSGHIHEENVETSAWTPPQSIVYLRRTLAQGIRRLLLDPLLEHIYLPCSYGNHGRWTEKKRIATGAYNSFEWMMYQILAEDFAEEKRVTFSCDPSAHQYVTAYGAMLHFTHGDELKFGGGIGGLSIPLGKRVATWDLVKRSKYHHIGHFHTFADYGPQRTVVNGSLIGYNGYAQSIGVQPEPPQQASYILDAKRGKTLVSPIWVGDREEERALWNPSAA